jgi:hypothetical protein
MNVSSEYRFSIIIEMRKSWQFASRVLVYGATGTTIFRQLRVKALLTLRITGFLDSVHCPEFQITRKHNVSKTESVSFFRQREGDAYSVGSLKNS